MFSAAIIDFWVSTVLYAFIPGPAMLYAAGQTLANGPRGGLQAVLGMHIGRYVHILSAIAGISLVMTVMPEFYAALRAVGAVYLLWIGFTTVMKVADAPLIEAGALRSGSNRSLWQSAWVEVLNPQTAMYFMTQMPRYVGLDDKSPVLKLFLLGIALSVIATLGDLTSTAFAGVLRNRLSEKAGMIRKAQLGGGSLIVGLGLHILLPAS